MLVGPEIAAFAPGCSRRNVEHIFGHTSRSKSTGVVSSTYETAANCTLDAENAASRSIGAKRQPPGQGPGIHMFQHVPGGGGRYGAGDGSVCGGGGLGPS